MAEHYLGKVFAENGFIMAGDDPEEFSGDCIAEGADGNREANAERLASCWNLHEELVAALKLRIEDHQCAVSCDGPHEGCPCWYCVALTVLAKVNQ